MKFETIPVPNGSASEPLPRQYAVSYFLRGRFGATTPEPAEGAMRDRYVLQGLGATNIRIVEVKT